MVNRINSLKPLWISETSFRFVWFVYDYSLVVSSEGIIWMGLTDEGALYAGTIRNVTLWNLNYVARFWALSRTNVTHLSVCGATGKSSRIVAVGEDSW